MLSSLASMISVPIPLPCLKTCKTYCNTMKLRSQLLTIDVQTFQMVSTNPISLYSLIPFGIRTIVVHIKASGMYPSWNPTCMSLTTFTHILVSGSFSLVAARNHALMCSAFIPDGPPTLPDRTFLTAADISRTSRGLFAILASWTKIWMLSPSWGRYL